MAANAPPVVASRRSSACVHTFNNRATRTLHISVPAADLDLTAVGLPAVIAKRTVHSGRVIKCSDEWFVYLRLLNVDVLTLAKLGGEEETAFFFRQTAALQISNRADYGY